MRGSNPVKERDIKGSSIMRAFDVVISIATIERDVRDSSRGLPPRKSLVRLLTKLATISNQAYPNGFDDLDILASGQQGPQASLASTLRLIGHSAAKDIVAARAIHPAAYDDWAMRTLQTHGPI